MNSAASVSRGLECWMLIKLKASQMTRKSSQKDSSFLTSFLQKYKHTLQRFQLLLRVQAVAIENVTDDDIGDDAVPGDIVVKEEEANPVLESLLDCAGVSGDQELLNCLWENVARSIQKS